MGLCDLCQTVEFDDLPSLPAHYQETTRPWDSLMVFLSLRLINARRAGESDKVEEFSQPLGRPHHQSIEELKSAAECCSICSLIAQAVSQSLAALEEGKMDARYVYHKRHERAPDFRLWLAKRRDDCDGFMVVSSSDRYPSDVYLLAAVGFCRMNH
ncbi:hypothetical protein K469DRAFT_365318 [Zopfia rhizophila CBS 207.26]|uniref:Uncharacterized protein n=1 Tax=Zopfia rhizophila CBS 207.26 TaxID=1314779 RepID=A0A6A6EK56_9PEZI|nr:hypothetical protein K469DRAFT_365318 [Zopfia rhizophila CBS 207.26]